MYCKHCCSENMSRTIVLALVITSIVKHTTAFMNIWGSGLLGSKTSATTGSSSVDSFIGELDYDDTLNDATKERTNFLNKMLESKVEVDVVELLKTKNRNDLTLRNPGLWESMQPVASGDWRVIYAPHMTTIANLVGGGNLEVQYLLNEDGTLASHAKFSEFFWIPNNAKIYLSVSGTFGSVDEQNCKVQWDRAWFKVVNSNNMKDEPYATFEDVPDSILKNLISFIGNLMFIEAVSVFPVSFLSNELIVFDFELLGTRICAKKNALSNSKFSPTS